MVYSNALDTTEAKGLLATEDKMHAIFQLLKANVFRSRSTLSVILLQLDNYPTTFKKTVEKDITQFLQSRIRESDILIKLSTPSEWCIFLSPSGEEEATAFIQRLFNSREDKETILFQCNEISFSAGIAEIGNSQAALDEIFHSARKLFSKQKESWTIEFVNTYKVKEVEKIRVSIIEDDNIFQKVLLLALTKLPLKQFKLDIQTFSDGYEFLQSDWYRSSHAHLIIMNDILPKKNGFEVLYALRKLPNSKRFITFMMTKKKVEEDMLYAYENGVDQYLFKPFNLRLFEAQVKRVLSRLWS
ncbi:Response regulator receiver domain-containing protein [Psychrobacillus sp. OK028]|uniref:response regulator n=1 Tax=Psychrobacillus sp. OK028 TaxID=1884359 RepID=UPI000890E439|nr:response regulator [Psychrobacillus sp. OK028]SDN30988.1 Response regulator receiver domain-containing protein [Psychrobacillus sp. OK028]